MKILVISHMYPSSFNEVAGIFVHEQVKEIVKQGHEVRVISPKPWSPIPIRWMKGKWRRYAEVPNKAVIEGIEVCYPNYIALPGARWFEYSGKWMYSAIKNLVRNIYKEFPFDIIHAHVALPDGYAAIKLKEKYDVPVVVTIHGQDLQNTIMRNNKCKEALIYVFDRSDKVVVVSNKLKGLMPTNNYKRKTCVIGNGIPLDKLKLIERMYKNYQYKQIDPLIILSVSNLIKTKGIDLNIYAMSYLIKIYPNLHYIIVGEGEERPYLERLVSKLGLNDHVTFTGLLPHKEVLQRMSQADIFSLPSWNEAFGVVYIEAMAQGIPVIACRGEGIEDVIEHGENGMLVTPKDVNSLTESIEFLLSNPEQAQKIAQRGRELVLQYYTWAKNAEKNIGVYKEVLNK